MLHTLYSQAGHFNSHQKIRRFIELSLTLLATLGIAASAYLIFAHSHLLAMLLIVPFSLCAVRCFIIQHDCSHGALFASKSANRALGRALSLLTFTPFTFWRWGHLTHHKLTSNLDQRGIGDIYMLTVKEYRDASKTTKLLYRLSRHPAIFLLFLAPLYFLVILRFSFSYYKKIPSYNKAAKHSIYLTNLCLFLFYGLLFYVLGAKFMLLIYLPSFLLAAMIGTWLFYVQHNFPDSYFVRQDNWDHVAASLEGASYYKLPWVLEWLTGYIGYHHIHHFNAKIPFYRLREAYLKTPEFQSSKTYSLKDTITLAKLALYDEKNGGFITWKQYRQS